MSKSKLLGFVGFTPSQYDRCLRENRLFSDTMLNAMGDSEYFDVTYLELKTWKLLDQYSREEIMSAIKTMGKEALLEALKIAFPNKQERRRIIEEGLKH
jgi:hypothetical protein